MNTLFLLLALLWGAGESVPDTIHSKEMLNIEKSGDDVAVFITPHPKYIAYTIFIHTKKGILKKELHSRKSLFKGAGKQLIDAQLIGEGVHGPEILFYRSFSKQYKPLPWKGDFKKSMNVLRLSYRVRPLSEEKRLEPVANNALARIKKGNLYHYTAKEGSLRHTTVQKGKMGENLYRARTLAEAWELLQKSPSHLYNILNPQYISFFNREYLSEGFHIGVLIFSSE
ncbi:hypothetical protein KAH37_03705 [bacterium]|nr:hypothetical protein [bacterium]